MEEKGSEEEREELKARQGRIRQNKKEREACSNLQNSLTVPPYKWDTASLKFVDAFSRNELGDNSAQKSELEGSDYELHAFFDQVQWVKSANHPHGIASGRHAALITSFHIASRLLNLRRVKEYMTIFLGSPSLPKVTRTSMGECISYPAMISSRSLDNAELALQNLAKNVFWIEDPNMWSDRNRKHTGMTMIGHPYVGDLKGQTVEEINEWDQKFRAEGLPNRRLTIAIPSQFVDAIVDSEDGTRPWTRAVFFAAYTMVHEIGHAIYWQSFNSHHRGGPEGKQEPFFASDMKAELGDALMAHIFSGWLVCPIDLTDGDADNNEAEVIRGNMMRFYRAGFCWLKQPRLVDNLDPGTRTYYSIPFSYIDQWTGVEFWAGEEDRFKPNTPFPSNNYVRRGETIAGGPIPSGSTYTDPFWNNVGGLLEPPTGIPQRWPAAHPQLPAARPQLPILELKAETSEERPGRSRGRHEDVKLPGEDWSHRPHDTMPSEQWQKRDLIRAGAIDPNFRHVSNLTAVELHPFFRREAWPETSDERYNALLPAFELSTRFIDLSAEYYTSFLPFSNYKTEPSFTNLVGGHVANFSSVIVKKNPSDRELNKAKSALLEVASNTAWLEDPHMVNNNQLGLTNCGFRENREYDVIPKPDRDDRAKKEGRKTRPLVIKITTLYGDALMDAKRSSARKLTATFACAITLVHEIGHAIFYANFANVAKGMGSMEPWVGEDGPCELGQSMIAWLFGGWEPEIGSMSNGGEESGAAYEQHEKSFKRMESHFNWKKQEKWTTERLLWLTDCSIPLSYIRRLFTQESWTDLETRAKTSYESELKRLRFIRLNLLHPRTPFDPATHSRRLHKMFSDPHGLGANWQDLNFQRGSVLKGGLEVDKLTQGLVDDLEDFEEEEQGIQLEDPNTYPYIDPYWDHAKDNGPDANSSGATGGNNDRSGLTAENLRYGVELEMVFAFNENLLRYILHQLVAEQPTRNPADTVRIIKDLPYVDRDQEPFNNWGHELQYRAYNSWATIEKDINSDPGQREPYTDEVPRILAECLRNNPAIDFDIECHADALESNKSAYRYKTWTVCPDTSVRGWGRPDSGPDIMTWLPNVFVESDYPDSFGMEIVSRVLNTEQAESQQEIEAICTALKDTLENLPSGKEGRHGAFVTNATALHVHVEAPPLPALKWLAYLVIIYEDQISRLHPLCQQKEHFTAQNSLETNRANFLITRENGSLHPSGRCSPLIDVHRSIFGSSDREVNIVTLINRMNPKPTGRHRIVNFAYANRAGDTKTVEFRQHRGTLEIDEISWWVFFCTGLVRLAKRAASDEDVQAKLNFENWEDPKIDIFHLFKMINMPQAGWEFYEAKIARYMNYPADGVLNAWHLELPRGSKEPGYGPPYPKKSPGDGGPSNPSGGHGSGGDNPPSGGSGGPPGGGNNQPGDRSSKRRRDRREEDDGEEDDGEEDDKTISRTRKSNQPILSFSRGGGDRTGRRGRPSGGRGRPSGGRGRPSGGRGGPSSGSGRFTDPFVNLPAVREFGGNIQQRMQPMQDPENLSDEDEDFD